jgi:hypothetical protein
MEGFGHSDCPVELRACPEHQNTQLAVTEHTPDAPDDMRTGCPVPEGWVPLDRNQSWEQIEEMFMHWQDSMEDNIGWCLLCDNPIYTVDDMIPQTNTHNCDAGRALRAGSQRPPRTRRSSKLRSKAK